ncbi:hypothetical protein [Thioalkalivibrio sp. ALJ24]|uniref:hypothetical protein n=1 Tax=Thioalkalivibrio sp. ALJ24 TaxID=545276 RepID=UPI0003828967|nr:hypothetical protein [Thioalkalivibrio sp. ALJ24]
MSNIPRQDDPRDLSDRVIDFLRAPATLLFLLGLLVGGLAMHLSAEPEVPEGMLLVTVHNDTEEMIEAIHFNFSHGESLTEMREGRIRPGERRDVALNHPPAAGFNMEVRYADGEEQSFCANRGVEGRRQAVRLYR